VTGSGGTATEKAVAAALLNVEKAARELDVFFTGRPGRWKLDGRLLSEDAAIALLSLHDYLNELEAARTYPDLAEQFLSRVGESS
jgi:hypothetical protein